jgi:hypothetical protein
MGDDFQLDGAAARPARPPSTARRLSDTLRSLGGALWGILPGSSNSSSSSGTGSSARRASDTGTAADHHDGAGQGPVAVYVSAPPPVPTPRGSGSVGGGAVHHGSTGNAGRLERLRATREPLPPLANLGDFVQRDDNRAAQRRILYRLHKLHAAEVPTARAVPRRYRLSEKEYRARKAILKAYDGGKNPFAQSRLAQFGSFLTGRRGSWSRAPPCTCVASVSYARCFA